MQFRQDPKKAISVATLISTCEIALRSKKITLSASCKKLLSSSAYSPPSPSSSTALCAQNRIVSTSQRIGAVIYSTCTTAHPLSSEHLIHGGSSIGRADLVCVSNKSKWTRSLSLRTKQMHPANKRPEQMRQIRTRSHELIGAVFALLRSISFMRSLIFNQVLDCLRNSPLLFLCCVRE